MEQDAASGLRSIERAKKSGALQRLQERGPEVQLADVVKRTLTQNLRRKVQEKIGKRDLPKILTPDAKASDEKKIVGEE